jgi:hypothetical protein
MRALRSFLLVIGVLLTFAAGCGDDDTESGGGDGGSDLSDEEQAYVDEAVEGFDPDRDAPMTEDDARCIATSMVETLGVDRLEEMGLTPESFASDAELPDGAVSEADARTMVDGISDCIDLRELFLAGFTEDESLSPEAVECLSEQFDEDLVTRSMVVLLSEGEDALSETSGVGAEMMQAFLACPGVLG